MAGMVKLMEVTMLVEIKPEIANTLVWLLEWFFKAPFYPLIMDEELEAFSQSLREKLPPLSEILKD